MARTQLSRVAWPRFISWLFILFTTVVLPAISMASDPPLDLAQQFISPPRQAQPWVFWMWLHANTTHAAITRDLEEMKAKGIVGCILYDCGAGTWKWHDKLVFTNNEYRVVPTAEYTNNAVTPIPTGTLTSWTPGWREEVRFAASECAHLGLDLILTVGRAGTSGAIPEEFGEQKLVWTETSLSGPLNYDETLPAPKVSQPRGTFPHPGATGYHLDVAVLAVPDKTTFSTADVVDLTEKMDSNGHLHWNMPSGNWKIIRFVQVPTYTRNDWGYFTDSLSTEALDQTWAATIGPLLKEMTPEERKGLKGVEDDSWEAGKVGWTKLFAGEFKKRRGYDLTPYLPVVAGINLDDTNKQAQVLRDYNLTISDLIAENHYTHLKTLANENSLTCYSEPAGPNYDQADMLKTCSRVDEAMAEFWMPSTHRPTMDSRFLLRNAANANHIYGKRITMCEAFTSLGPEWEESPFDMKPVGDQAFCDGLNRACIHNFSHSPSLTAEPGYMDPAGTHYDRNVTWWDQTPAFNTYLARCSAMLQAGKFVADAIFYHGDNIGKGEPRKKIHPNLGEGYDHDNCNSEVLLTRMNVRDGRITLPDGMNYRVLVLPDHQPMPLKDLRKIAALIHAGATVVGPPPIGISGNSLQSSAPENFKSLANELWGGMDGARVVKKKIGAGLLVWGQTVRQALQNNGVAPDFEVNGVSDSGIIDWIHRQADGSEIYFVASRWQHPEKVDCTFRVAGKQPELWDPVTGEMRNATAFHQDGGRTVVPLQFDPCGSIFVVFRNPLPADATAGKTVSNYPSTERLATISGDWTVNFDPKWGGPESVVFHTLTDWTNRPEPGIRYYSGTAIYHKTFNVSARAPKGQHLLLDLGEVHEIASVRLNGHDLGVLWTRPSRVDVTDVVKVGDNQLEITVVNLWPNRLIGDSSLPEESRLTKTNIRKFSPATPLLPSGLLGPVNLLIEEPPAMK